MTRDGHGGDEARENVGSQFDRLPATADDRTVEGRATREAVVGYFAERFGVPPGAWEGFSLWEKGAGTVWAFHGGGPDGTGGAVPDPVAVEALGTVVLRTRQEHWKPTTDAAQRFGRAATRNVVELDRREAARFLAGEDQDLAWDGDWGYLVAAHELAGGTEPVGVGLYTYGTLQSMVPKGRRRRL